MASPQTEYFFPHFPPPSSPAAVPPPLHLVPPSPTTKSPPPYTVPPPSPTTRPPPPHIIPPPSPTTRPPPPRIIPPPSPTTRSPPPPHTIPPPSPATRPPPPHAIPPPHVTPPPPHMLPPPAPHTIPPPPPPSPGNHTTIIVVVFVSCGVFFLAFVMAALWCFLKKKRKMVQKTENFHIDEHRTVKESIVQGPHGAETVVLSVEDDMHIEEDIRKCELENFRKGLHLNPGENAIAGSMEAGEPSSSGSNTRHHGHQT